MADFGARPDPGILDEEEEDPTRLRNGVAAEAAKWKERAQKKPTAEAKEAYPPVRSDVGPGAVPGEWRTKEESIEDLKTMGIAAGETAVSLYSPIAGAAISAGYLGKALYDKDPVLAAVSGVVFALDAYPATKSAAAIFKAIKEGNRSPAMLAAGRKLLDDPTTNATAHAGNEMFSEPDGAKWAWQEMGIESPWFKEWSGGGPVLQPTIGEHRRGLYFDYTGDGPVVLAVAHGSKSSKPIPQFRVPEESADVTALRSGLPGSQSAGRAIYFAPTSEEAATWAGRGGRMGGAVEVPSETVRTMEYKPLEQDYYDYKGPPGTFRTGPSEQLQPVTYADPETGLIESYDPGDVYPVFVKMESPLNLNKPIKDSFEDIGKILAIQAEARERDLKIARRLGGTWEESVVQQYDYMDQRFIEVVYPQRALPDWRRKELEFKVMYEKEVAGLKKDLANFDRGAERFPFHTEGARMEAQQEIVEELAEAERELAEALVNLDLLARGDPAALRAYQRAKGISVDDSLGVLFGDDGLMGTPSNISDLFLKHGYDGIISSDWNLPEVIVFDPKQVKSQFNRGTFDPKDPRIMYGAGGAAAAAEKTKEQK